MAEHFGALFAGADAGIITRFRAQGFPALVSGIQFYRGTGSSGPAGGVPLGGLGTGYVDFNADGTWGKSSTFNTFVPPRPLGTPVFTLRVDGELRSLSLHPPEGQQGVESICYWGHYPVADVCFQTDLPVVVEVRAFTPFLPGDAAASNTPGTVLSARLRNTGPRSVSVALTCHWPGQQPRKGQRLRRREHQGDDWHSVIVEDPRGAGSALGVAATGLLGSTDGVLDVSMAEPASEEDPALAVTVRCSLDAGASIEVPFVLGWYAPLFRDSDNAPHYHRYSTRFASAAAVAGYLATNAATLLERTLAWQDVIYRADLPVWLQDALVNGLYSLGKNTLWTTSGDADSWWGPDGLFTHSESFTGCPITETMVCRFHGHFPLLFFFPELERTTLRAFAHYQLKTGEIPFSFGKPNALNRPHYQCQHPINSTEFVQLVHRYVARTSDLAFLREMWPIVLDALRFARTLDTDGDGLVNDQSHAPPGEYWPANQFYDIWPWYGTSCYVAGIGLAALSSVAAMADQLGEEEQAAELRAEFARGADRFKQLLWNGRSYRLWADPANGRQSDVSLANQLMAEWCARVLGVPSPLPPEHARSAMEHVLALNARDDHAAIVNGVEPDGSPHVSRHDVDPNDHAAQCFVGENLCAAMTMAYLGRQEAALTVAEHIYRSIAERHRTPWNWYCLIGGADGRPIWGLDYYSDMVIWALPMALAGQDITTFSTQGGLIDRLLVAVVAEAAQRPAAEAPAPS
ncbi:MAG: GH116 family glycosyl hydrolase [Chloroflexi bacterium]|nr:GH116 family glycosyl hydrolase [Chloroflexota bacterium]